MCNAYTSYRYGPPTNNGDDIKDVTINADESCDDGSEHTWVRMSK